MGKLKRWVIRRVVFSRLIRLYRRNEDMGKLIDLLKGKKTMLATLFGALVALLQAFGQQDAADQLGQVQEGLASGDPKLMLMAAAGFIAWLFDRVGRKREHEETLKAIRGA